VSYRASFLLGLVSGFALLTTFFFLGRTVGTTELMARFRGGYFGFAIVGLAAMGPLHAALMELSRRVRDAQVSGTLEAVLAAPVGPGTSIVLSAIGPLLSSVLRMTALLAAAALLFGLPLQVQALPQAAAALALSLVAFLALGVLSAAFTIRFKRGDPVAYFVDVVSVLLGGVFYPVDVLPPFLRSAADLLPLTHALQALRLALLSGADLSSLGAPLARLALFAAVLLPVALLTFAWAVRRAKDDGSLTHF
jgi:ABC-2 type transport system permease protein